MPNVNAPIKGIPANAQVDIVLRYPLMQLGGQSLPAAEYRLRSTNGGISYLDRSTNAAPDVPASGENDPYPTEPVEAEITVTVAGAARTSTMYLLPVQIGGVLDLAQPLTPVGWVAPVTLTNLITDVQAAGEAAQSAAAAVAAAVAGINPALAGIAHERLLLQGAVDTTTVQLESDLLGRPDGAYIIVATNERVWWTGTQITARNPAVSEVSDEQLTGVVGLRVQTGSLYARAISAQLVSQGALKRTRAAVGSGTLRVAWWGDSITEGYDVADIADSYAQRVLDDIRRALPGITIEVMNFAIGGRNAFQAMKADYTASADPNVSAGAGFHRPWGVAGKSWKDHVRDWQPDLLVWAMGMNMVGAGGGWDRLEAQMTQQMLDETRTWPSRPSVVVVPTILPTTNGALYGQSNAETQAVARADRLVAQANGAAVADANRLYGILRDGRDDVTRSSVLETNWRYWGTGAWTGTTGTWTLSGNAMTVNAEAAIYRAQSATDVTLEVTANYQADATVAVFLRDDPDLGNYTIYLSRTAIQVYAFNPVGSPQFTLVAGAGDAAPLQTATRYRIELRDQRLTISRDGVQKLASTHYGVLHDGRTGMSSHPYVILAGLNLILGSAVERDPYLSEADLLGDGSADGNRINHPTGTAHALVYQAAFGGVVRELAREAGRWLPQRIAAFPAAGWQPSGGGGYPTHAGSGERLWYVIVPRYSRLRTSALIRTDTGAAYTDSGLGVTPDQVASLRPGEYALDDVFLFITVPGDGEPTWPTDLYTYR